MSLRSLRPQLNQIRTWVQQGRTDAWIAHQLEISTADLKNFRRQHDLSADGAETDADHDLRDEIEAEIAAATEAEEARLAAEEAERAEREREEQARKAEAGDDDDRDDDGDDDEDSDGERRPRRRRRRRRSRSPKNRLEGSFDQGDDGFGLWFDPAIQDLDVYKDNWAGQTDITVTVEADRIVIQPAGGDSED